MNPYILRLSRLGFSDIRAQEIYLSFVRQGDLEDLDHYISDLEYCWGE